MVFPVASHSSRMKPRTSAMPIGSRPLIARPNQQFRVVHDGQCDGKTASCPAEYWENSFLSRYGRLTTSNAPIDVVGAFESSQIGKNLKIFRPCQIRVKSRRFNQGADAGRMFFRCRRSACQNLHVTGRWSCKAQQHPHGGGFPAPLRPQRKP